MKTLINFFKLNLIILCLFTLPQSAQAYVFVNDDITHFSYDECTGEIFYRFLFTKSGSSYADFFRKQDESTAGASVTAFIIDENNVKHPFFKRQWNANGTSTNTYIAPFNGTIHLTGSGGNTTQYYQQYITTFPAEFYGQSLKLRIEGSWREEDFFDTYYTTIGQTRPESATIPMTPFIEATAQTNSCTELYLSWGSISQQTITNCVWDWGVKVYRNNVLIESDASTGYLDETVSPGTEYDYKFVAWVQAGQYSTVNESFNSFLNDVYTYPDPGPVTNFSASSGTCNGQIVVSWDWSGDNLQSFKLQRRVHNSGSFVDISGNLNSSSRSFTDNNALDLVEYDYRIYARNICNRLSNSVETSSPGSTNRNPAPVDILYSGSVAGKGLKLAWPSATSAISYQLERIQVGGSGSTFIDVEDDEWQIAVDTGILELDVVILVGDLLYYLDESVVPCQTYEYRIRSVNACVPEGVLNENETASMASSRLVPDLGDSFEENDLLGSKGYFPDRVELQWTVAKNENFIESYKIYRKVQDSPDDANIIQTLPAGSNFYVDEFTDAGVIYEYFIKGTLLCDGDFYETNIVSTVGFRSPFGIVSGNISYAGGVAVEGVTITAELSTEGEQAGHSLEFTAGSAELLIDNNSNLMLTNELLIEFWMRPASYDNDVILVEKEESYELKYNSTTDTYDFTIFFNGNGISGQSKTLSVSAQANFSLNEFTHMAVQLRENYLTMYANGDSISAIYCGTSPFNPNYQIDIDDNENHLHIGNGYIGILDEFRFWNKSKTDSIIQRDYIRLMTGEEAGLRIYLRMDENVGTVAYDLSRVVTTFHRNHATFSNTTIDWSDQVPSINELGVRATTDNNGNYRLNIPFVGVGQTFTLTPIFGIHEFEPSQRLLYIGDASSVYGPIDFLDKSSFQVTGFLEYPKYDEDQSEPPCRIDGANIKIDGQVVIVDGSIAQTDANGMFEIQVPIGKHFIEVEQAGHTYSVGRYPAEGKFDFQDDLDLGNDYIFIDDTKMTIIGKVVGGLREAQHFPGFGNATNNIGSANIHFKSILGSGCYQGSVETDPATGEYMVELPPLEYQVDALEIPSNPDVNFDPNDEGIPTLDLSDTPPMQEFNELDENGNEIEPLNTVSYNKQRDFIYRVAPEIEVTGLDEEPFIGEETYTYQDSNDEPVTRNLREQPFTWPVFTRDHEKKNFMYSCLIQVYEEYKNFDADVNNPVIDKVPTTDGTLRIDNELSLQDQLEGEVDIDIEMSEVNTLDQLKKIKYDFKPGVPNFSEITNEGSEQNSFTHKWNIFLINDNGQNATWPEDEPYRAYMLGALANGPSYVTNGPEVVEYILRDPPGSNSFASLTQGTSRTKSSTWDWTLSNGLTETQTTYLGTKVNIGLGVSTETNIEANINGGVSVEASGGGFGEQIVTTTQTTTYSTYAGSDRMSEAQSDVFIATSKNIETSVAKILTIVLADDSALTLGGPLTKPDPGFKFGQTYAVSIVPEGYATHFALSHFDIVNFKIPDLIDTRDALLQSNGKWTSHLPIGDEHYGKSNDDPVFGDDATESTLPERLSGPSYTYEHNPNVDSLKTWLGDYVRQFNKQIELWENALKLNEWEKVNIEDLAFLEQHKQLALDKLESENAEMLEEYAELESEIEDGLANYVIPIPALFAFVSFAVAVDDRLDLAALKDEKQAYDLAREKINQAYSEILTSQTALLYTAGNPVTKSVTHETIGSVTENIDYELVADMSIEASAKISNNGIGLEKGFNVAFSSGRSWTEETGDLTTVDWTWDDENIGDEVTFEVYRSILGFGPIFKKKGGGRTSCPHEEALVTEYYQPGTVISEGTQQTEKPKIAVEGASFLYNIPADEPAIFTLSLDNESESNIAVEYILALHSPSNEDGAIVRVDGAVLGSQPVPIQPNNAVQKVLTVEKGPGQEYQYDSLLVLLHSSCQFYDNTGWQTEIVDSVYITAHFLPTCTDIALSNPELQWVVNSSFNNELDINITDYNYNFPDLDNIHFDFKPASQADWIQKKVYYKDENDAGPDDGVISTLFETTSYLWDIEALPDGPYDLRATSHCLYPDPGGTSKTSVTYSGIVDRVRPHPFGTPSPALGILTPNDEISIKFNEAIDAGQISETFNFDVRGIKNGSEVSHGTSVNFNGTNHLEVNGGVSLQKRDFTIEFVAKRDDLGGIQVIMAQGSDITHDLMAIFFNGAGQLVFRINNQWVESDITFNDNDWHYFAVSYDYEGEMVFMYYEGSDFLINTTTGIQSDIETNGKFVFGKNSQADNAYFQGNLHDVRIWNYTRTLAQWSESKSKLLSGSELGLLHNWRMDEGEGNIAIDQVRRRDASSDQIDWEISPSGWAAEFDGVDDYLKVFTGDVNITQSMDFTLEFWYNSALAGEATLFSNGSATGMPSDALTSWNITKDADGKIHILHDGIDFIASDNSYLDNAWNHFAMTLRRGSNLSVYINGELQNSTPSLPYKQFGGTHMYLGVRGFLTGIVENFENFFTGKIDEFRFWNTARTAFQINRDKNFRLSEDELGLQVYLPFEDYEQGVPTLNGTFEAQAEADSVHVVFDENGTALSEFSPSIKIPRPVQAIGFEYSVNNDEIIITPTSSPEDIENVTIDITVEKIKDLHGNVMESPETWIAYVDKNQVVWQDDLLIFEMLKGEELIFSSAIVNQGGEVKTFEIMNIPPWLSVSPSSGTVNPNSAMNVSFEIDPQIAIGDYEHDISLLTDFNFPEKLTIDLKVRDEEPDWTVDPNDFEFSMSVIGKLKIRNVISTDDEDILMAMVNNEVRGLAKLEYVEAFDSYMAFLSIYSNISSGENLEFQIWDASSGTVYSDVTPDNLSFTENILIGSASSPEIFETNGEISVDVAINEGWNWLGFFLENDDPTDLDEILGSLNSMSGDQIKGQTSFSNYSSGWTGSLNVDGIQPEELYKFKSSTDDVLVQKGDILDPTTIDINLANGWNWIGFVSIRNQGIAQALGGLMATDGDLIKSKSQFAVYDGNMSVWIGNLNTLIPGQGFMYNSVGTKTFNYPFAGMFKSTSAKPDYFNTDFWTVDHSPFATNMTMISGLDNNCQVELAGTKYALGLFNEAEVIRSLSPIQKVNDAELSFLTIAGNNGDELNVQLLNTETGEELALGQSFIYESNRHLGALNNPVLFDISDEVCLKLEADAGMYNELFTAFPSVFVNGLTLDFVAERKDEHARIKMFDIYGQLVFESQIVLNEGYNRNRLDLSMIGLNSGVYMIELFTGNSSQSVKVIKAK